MNTKPIYAKYIDQNTIEIAPFEKDGIVGFQHNKELCLAEGYDKMLISDGSKGNIITYEVSGDFLIEKRTESSKLLVAISNPYLNGKSEEEIKLIDVEFFENLTNFKRFSRGYKVYSRYYNEPQTGTPIPIGNTWQDDGFTNCPAVERLYSLVWENDILAAEQVIMNWYNEDESIAFSKTTVNPFSAKDAAKKLKDIRETQILYLQNPEAEYVNPTVKEYIDVLFGHYKSEVSDYILSGNDAFLNAINNETNEQILQILNAVLADGKTVKESILYQITKP